MLSGLREFAESVRQQSQDMTEAMAAFDRRVSALERLLDPLPPGLNGAHVEALGDSVSHLRAEGALLQETFRAHSSRLDQLERLVRADGQRTGEHALRIESLERRLEAVVVEMANQRDGEFDGD